MLFNSFLFLLAFLPIVVVGYWLIARMTRPGDRHRMARGRLVPRLPYLSGERVYP